MLVLDSSHTKADQDAVNQFVNTVREQERIAILKWINNHRTYTELEAGIGVWRDHFTAEDLVRYLRGEQR